MVAAAAHHLHAGGAIDMFMKKNIGGPYASESDENVKAARGRQPCDMGARRRISRNEREQIPVAGTEGARGEE